MLVHTHCEIIYGGKTSEQLSRDIYTLKRFAEDIGIKRNTLQVWYESFRNINLVLQNIENRRFKRKERKGEVTVNEKPKDYIFGLSMKERIAIREMKKKVNRKTPEKEVEKIFNKELKRCKEDRQLDRHIQSAIGINNFLCCTNLKSLNHNDLTALKNVIEKCLNHINLELIEHD